MVNRSHAPEALHSEHSFGRRGWPILTFAYPQRWQAMTQRVAVLGIGTAF